MSIMRKVVTQVSILIIQTLYKVNSFFDNFSY
jgi:hypothetical protein